MGNVTLKIRVALAGNANVGKSIIFNYLTGLHQHIGNWLGKTIERTKGSVFYKGYEIEIIDLPGIYSLSTYSLEEIVSRKYILCEKPDLIINIVDGGILWRDSRTKFVLHVTITGTLYTYDYGYQSNRYSTK